MKTPAELMMERETRVQLGAVPRSLFGEDLHETSWQLKDQSFLLRGEGDHYFFYRKGDGLIVERGDTADLNEESLWLNGSVYAAIASINGLLPIHASAVAHNGQVFAFTGPAGSGKSTLVAALAQFGLPMFCDDTLVFDLSDPGRIVCLPGHKRLKLRPDAILLSGANPEEQVSAVLDKRYARSAAGVVEIALPLAELVFLEEGPETSIAPIIGAERLIRLRDDHYTAQLFAAARQSRRADEFARLTRLAKTIPMTRFVRPMDTSRFHETVIRAAQHVTGTEHE